MFLTVNLAQDSSKISNYISETLLEHIDITLEKGEKVLLYLNKRGSHSSLICEDCQYLYNCPNCDVSLSVHGNPDHLRCHICNNAFNIPTSCSQCNKNNLKPVGVGTQQVENILKDYYKDTVFGKPSHLNSLSQREKEATEYFQKKYNPEYITSLSKDLRKMSTESEATLWEVLKNKKFRNLKFRRQHPIGRYIADFYCHELKLVIELDGRIHENRKEYDEIRDEIIGTHDISVLRFFSQDVFQKLDTILNSIIPYIPLPLGEVRGGQKLKRNVGGEVRGGQKLEKGVTIYRFDSDSMKNISSKREALSHLDTADIIIGTKMLTTGFNFEKIGLICILLVESELSYPSYDAGEKAYTNLRQLIGRGNRKSQETSVLLQTFIPKNPLVEQLTGLNFKDFFSQTLAERKEFDYPPYKQMVTLEYRHKDSKKSLLFTQKLLEQLQAIDSKKEYLFLRGSSTFKKNNTHHATLIVKGKNIRSLLKQIEKTIISQSALSVIFH